MYKIDSNPHEDNFLGSFRYCQRNDGCQEIELSEDFRIHWTMFQNINLWFDNWELFLVAHGFGKINDKGELALEDFAASHIINMDATFILLYGSNGNQGGWPSVTFYDKRFLQLGKAMLMLALMTTMINGSNAVGNHSPPFSNSKPWHRLLRQNSSKLNAFGTCVMW